LFSIPFGSLLLFRSGPIVRLSDDGIDDVRLRVGLIPWRDISSVSVYTIRNRPIIQLWLRDADSYLMRWPRWRRALSRLPTSLGYSAFVLDLSFLNPGFGPVYAFISRHVSARSDT